MLPTIIIGLLFFGIIALAARKSIRAIRNNSCPGCSGACSEQEKKTMTCSSDSGLTLIDKSSR